MEEVGEWIKRLRNQYELHAMLEDKQYWYDNYIEWGERGNFIQLIYDRRTSSNIDEVDKHLENYIRELENNLIEIVENIKHNETNILRIK